MRNLLFLALAVLAASAPAFAQPAGSGSIEGVITDARGLALSGVTVSLSGPQIIGYRAATTDVDGAYRFRALPAGTYTLTSELLGYEPVKRDGLVVTTGRALSLELSLAPAALQPEPDPAELEAAGPPPVDTKSAGATATFTGRLLDDVPSAANLWAVLEQSPGIQMHGYDVGGTHIGEQTPYDAFGIRGQNRVVQDGVNTTEGLGGAGGYYDYFAGDEFKVSAQGLDVEMSTPGAQVRTTWKSGTNRLGGMLQGNFGHEDLVVDNIDEELEARGATPSKLREAYDYHVDLGGPIVKDRAWFYVATSKQFVDRAVSGHDPEAAEEADDVAATEVADIDTLTGKVTIRLTERDQLIGSGHWGLIEQPNSGLSLLVGPDSVLAKETTTELYKGEWQRTWTDRLSTSVLVGYYGSETTAVPLVDALDAPPRLDTSSGLRSGAGWAPFTLRRSKPQSTGQIRYQLPLGRAGTHEVKVGWDWQRDQNGPAWSDASGGIRYLDNSQFGKATSDPNIFVDRILFANFPTQGETDHNEHTAFFLQDVWRLNDRFTFTLGARLGRQHVYYTDVVNDPLETEVFERTSATRADLIDEWKLAPRAGVAIDLTGRGRSVLKGYYGRFYANLGSGLEAVNPGGRGTQVFDFLDTNGNGFYDGRHELGTLLEAHGGGRTQLDPAFQLPYSDEFSVALEQQLATDLGIRFSLVQKRYRNWWESNVNLAQALNLTNAVAAVCTGCPLGFADTPINLLTVPDDQANAVDSRLMNVPLLATTGGDGTDLEFTTWQVAMTRRFRNNFYLSASFDRHDRDELRSPLLSVSPYVADPLEQGWFQNHNADVPNRQRTTYWAGKLLLRWVIGSGFGFGLNTRYQSGFPWAPVYYLRVPNVGTQAIFLEDPEDNRSDDVLIADVRLDKTWAFGGHYRLTAVADAYNVLNLSPVTNFVLYSGSQFDNVIEWLPGLTFKFGLRLQF